jgi:hypothetical protein
MIRFALIALVIILANYNPWIDRTQATVNEVTARNDYVGNGSTTTFPYLFKILTKADIVVYVNGILKVVDIDYSVTGLGAANGGIVIFGTAPANTLKVALLRNQPIKQTSVYQANEPFPARRIETDLDKTTMIEQRLYEMLNRSLHVQPYNYPFDASLDITAHGGQYIRLKSDLSAFEWSVGTGIKGDKGDPGTGTVNGTNEVRARPAVWTSTANLLSSSKYFIDVTLYGAACDGVQDDTVFIQTAITVVGSNGNVFLPGWCKVTSLLTIANSGVKIKGVNQFSSGFITNDATGNVLSITATDAVDISDIGFDSSVTRTDGAYIKISGNGSVATQRLGMDRVAFYNASTCVDFEAAAYWTVTRIFCYPTVYGLRIRNTINADEGDSSLSNSVIVVPAGGMASALIQYESSGGLKISNVKLNNVVGSSSYGIGLNVATTASTSVLTVTNLSVEGFTSSGIAINPASGKTFEQWSITGSEVRSVGGSSLTGINITSDGAIRGVITGNIIYVNGANSNDIAVTAGHHIMISGNTLVGDGSASQTGVKVQGTPDNIVVGPNNFNNLTKEIIGVTTEPTLRDTTKILFANLPSAAVGSQLYCADCKGWGDSGFTAGMTCVTGGSGSPMFRQNNVWKCH